MNPSELDGIEFATAACPPSLPVHGPSGPRDEFEKKLNRNVSSSGDDHTFRSGSAVEAMPVIIFVATRPHSSCMKDHCQVHSPRFATFGT